MTKINQILAALAAVLLVASVLTYRQSIARGDRFERGQTFLSNLNPSEIESIIVTKGEETVTLDKQDERFVIAEADGYPAKNEAINRLIRDVLELSLEKEVGTGEDLQEELELEPMTDSTVDVVFEDSNDDVMVRFRVGKPFQDGAGHYVQRFDTDGDPIYLTSESVYLSTTKDSFLDKQILDVGQDEIAKIQGADFVIQRNEENNLELADVPSGMKAKSTETSRLKTILSGLRFDKVYPADDEEVSDLEFEPALSIDLEDQSGYVLSHATKDDRHFMKVSGFHQLSRVEISQQSSDEELEEKAELLARADEIQKFNNFHGSWVYEVTSSLAEKLELRRDDLIESTST